MQTFMPYSNFKQTAKCLDYRRLGKQRVEAHQILNTLNFKRQGITHKNGRKIGWMNHPAVLMWEGYEESLKQYMNVMIQEWIDRGYNNTMRKYPIRKKNLIHPQWITKDFIKAHRSNLLRKDNEYYSQFNWNVPDDLEYVWPV